MDGNNLLIRAIHAADKMDLTAQGVSTGGLLIFINLLSRHLREEAPDVALVCWDGGRSIFRTMILPEYKAARHDRDEHEDERKPFGLAKRFLTLSNISHVERQGWEADDLIAAYWRQLRPSDSAVIISSDHDLLQLINPNVTQVKVSSKPPTDRWTVARVVDELGCKPEQLPYTMALSGDRGDGIPGLPGIGHKKALRKLNDAGGSWDNLLRSLTPADFAIAQLTYALVDLRTRPYQAMCLHLAPAGRFSPTAWGDVLYPSLHEFLTDYKLHSVLSRLDHDELWHDKKEGLLAYGNDES